MPVLHTCEIWSLRSGEEHGLRVFQNRVLRRIFGPTRQKVTQSRENRIMSFMFCTSHHGNLSKDCAMGRKCGTYVGKKKCIQNSGGET